MSETSPSSSSPNFDQCREPRFGALVPFLVFMAFYLGLSLWAGDFYRTPMPVAFLVASAVAMLDAVRMMALGICSVWLGRSFRS